MNRGSCCEVRATRSNPSCSGNQAPTARASAPPNVLTTAFTLAAQNILQFCYREQSNSKLVCPRRGPELFLAKVRMTPTLLTLARTLASVALSRIVLSKALSICSEMHSLLPLFLSSNFNCLTYFDYKKCILPCDLDIDVSITLVHYSIEANLESYINNFLSLEGPSGRIC